MGPMTVGRVLVPSPSASFFALCPSLAAAFSTCSLPVPDTTRLTIREKGGYCRSRRRSISSA